MRKSATVTIPTDAKRRAAAGRTIASSARGHASKRRQRGRTMRPGTGRRTFLAVAGLWLGVTVGGVE